MAFDGTLERTSCIKPQRTSLWGISVRYWLDDIAVGDCGDTQIGTWNEPVNMSVQGTARKEVKDIHVCRVGVSFTQSLAPSTAGSQGFPPEGGNSGQRDYTAQRRDERNKAKSATHAPICTYLDKSQVSFLLSRYHRSSVPVPILRFCPHQRIELHRAMVSKRAFQPTVCARKRYST